MATTTQPKVTNRNQPDEAGLELVLDVVRGGRLVRYTLKAVSPADKARRDPQPRRAEPAVGLRQPKKALP